VLRGLSLLLAVLLVMPPDSAAEALEFSSGDSQVGLLELYTSEGCSSCPPADRWLSRFKDHPDLWKTIVPVAFHVDYWDYIGWSDRFADARYSERQRSYAGAGLIRNVYTPGLIWRGREWRGFFSGRDLPEMKAGSAGMLHVRVESGYVEVEFRPAGEPPELMLVNLALLGFNLASEVAAGENRGTTLTHDFAVLGWSSARMVRQNGGYSGRFNLPAATVSAPERALAVWMTHQHDPMPVQATGGWLYQ